MNKQLERIFGSPRNNIFARDNKYLRDGIMRDLEIFFGKRQRGKTKFNGGTEREMMQELSEIFKFEDMEVKFGRRRVDAIGRDQFGRKIFIEGKKNLMSTSECDRLMSQIRGYANDNSFPGGGLVVIFGDARKDLYDDLMNCVRDLNYGSLLGTILVKHYGNIV